MRYLVESVAEQLDLGGLDLRRQHLRLIGDQMRKAAAQTRNWSVVVGQHREAERDRQEQTGEAARRHGVPFGAGERRPHAEPRDEDRGESAKHGGAHRHEHLAVTGQEIDDGAANECKRIDLGHDDSYGSRKVAKASAVPTALARNRSRACISKAMCALMAMASASRLRLAPASWVSRMAIRI